MKTMNDEALNRVSIVGKLLDTSFREGTSADGRPYQGVTATVRVTQTFGGKEETEEIPVRMFASQYTKDHKPSKSWEFINSMKAMRTAQNVGLNAATAVRFNLGRLRENDYVGRNGTLYTGWDISANFGNESNSGAESATFICDIFIIDMHPEENREGDATGRLIVRGAIPQYGGRLDVIDFIVENPEAVDYIERNWNVNDTVTVKGRVRMTVKEETGITEGSWGEDVPEERTRAVRELIITKGDDQGKDEDLAYDPAEIKKAFNARKARLEQLQLDNQMKHDRIPESIATDRSPKKDKYSWE